MTQSRLQSGEPPLGIPSPTLAVIGAGFGRTGTLSLRMALERLGFSPCDHMSHNFEHPERFALWLDAVERKRTGQPIDWRPLLGGYRAAVDWPSAHFWRELASAHPNAKVILSVRDPERWYESARTTIYPAREEREATLPARLRTRVISLVNPSAGRGFRTVEETVWRGTFGGRFTDRDHALRVFRSHVDEVIATIPPERLLVYEVSRGWEPLCAFLGVPPPQDEPFPRANDAADFAQRQGAQGSAIDRQLAPSAAAAATAVAFLTAFLLARRSRRRNDA
jgi:hypothetical protein